MGKEQPRNTETPKIEKISNFLEEVKKVTYGEILGSVFLDFTLDETRKFKKDNILIGKTENKENPPLIVLTDLSGAGKIRLQIFRKETDFKRYPGSGDLIVWAGPDTSVVEIRQTITFDLKPADLDPYSLSDGYRSFLIDILGEVNSRFKEARRMKNG
jgi:hypothetical protein